MAYKIETRVIEDQSIDPSYIVHYQVTDDGHLIGDGIVEYNRQAIHNDITVSESIPLEARKQVQEQIITAAQHYIKQLQ
ncbi:hypothetical protein [Desulfoscipio gibsoniae]|uniref:Uncharacterized protein n=1 Tax=Desulfoscipio gibsoniae DSM 7213 TaxID=767817 RepID=R4KSX2_9FIRM|nr:hypothetical protein [Desulfoscipio gibsoniae]AGL02696.1 hypothetical protein Desgi_3351 [Desulfoscipio gibsoniae DSM 7213]